MRSSDRLCVLWSSSKTVLFSLFKNVLYNEKNIFWHIETHWWYCRTIEEAIERANKTTYGLAAGIVTNDLNIANTISRSIRAGVIWINCYHNFDSGCPIGGYKMSGFGKDHGMEGLCKYLQTKAVVTPIYNSPWL